jgi:predicted dinucleotide-binding enzyme
MSTIAVIPGTGNIGFGVAWRLARAGQHVLLGSREASKAQEAAKKILAEFPNAKIQSGKSEDLPFSTA